MGTKQTTVRVRTDLYNKLKEESEQIDRSVSYLINKYVSRGMKLDDKKK
ncbi:hypothetical protein PN294_14860 [Romboutsia sp. 1001216sp1]|nr:MULTISPECIES: hypothetical protein [unclassified Romboutsia]MDB8803444.1 hypothetical protein [Romboutsia sp. 1001216sp1]MDB8803453.1 hypothetical protein [Romboutsia sp. 1001216sp1]MDB8814834.1 hypothetical protein [Romboutsia sp. 1001216sp1]MDB8814843.1 hypothetical protein [Romboutsia sp. 1001216sp1]